MRVFGAPGLGQGWEERRLRALTGVDAEEAVTARLRRLLDEEHDSLARPGGKRALPAGEGPSMDRRQRRIEHLEAIVTSRDWDLLEAEGLPPDAPAPASPWTRRRPARTRRPRRAARLARRVR